ncbi:hypothetical protein DPMN_050511 [Dreissena polymorpha]|uniref:Uncharacterized protein n=1 Tax=Dreissena polymorpha TaxID=45954 RepID=A0A9D4CHN8_DREPO|nr:hypothetical protein DPMN_050511 [Dreissena polymorpha]
MQCILVSDGMYTYIMLNYDQEQFSIGPLPEVPVASGYTHPDNTSTILSNRHNFTYLNKGTNVIPGTSRSVLIGDKMLLVFHTDSLLITVNKYAKVCSVAVSVK